MGKRARCKTPTVGKESEWEALSLGQRSDGIMVDDGSVAGSDEHFSEFDDLRDEGPEEVPSYMKLCS